jgi:hypothetical protein
MGLFKRIGNWFGGREEQAEAGAVVPASVLAISSDEVVNDAASYGVAIVPATVAPGAWYWRVVRVHHLTPEQNGGNHHIYVDVLDPELGTEANPLGKRVNNARVKVTWEGGEQVLVVDKPLSEPGTNFPMWKWQVCAAFVLGLVGQELPSDQVTGVHTGHPDEAPGNTLFHHSFGLTFSKTRAPDLTHVQSVVYGRVRGGTGHIAVLLRGEQAVARQTLGADELFRFANLMAGTYVVTVEGTDLRSQSVTVNGEDQAQLELSLTHAESALSGRVRNGAGRTLTLYRDGTEDGSQTVNPDETYRFGGLTAGAYRVQVAGTAVSSDVVTLDGTNAAVVDLEVPVQPGKPLAHYVLFGPPESPATGANLLLAQDFILAFGLTLGFNPGEAAKAAMVTIIADSVAVSQEIQAGLVAGGARVQRIAGSVSEVAAALAARVAAKQPFM